MPGLGVPGALVLIAAVWLPLAAPAQNTAAPGTPPPERPQPPPVLVVNQDVLFAQSAFGRSAQARLEAESSALVAENRVIEAALETEERDLTDRRATLPPDEFRALAEAFNVKVEAIRKAQDAKSRSISRARDADRQRFFAAALPVLADILRENGAVLVLDQSQVVLSLDRIDITTQAIARLDAAIGTGALSGEAPPPDLAPPPDPAPAP